MSLNIFNTSFPWKILGSCLCERLLSICISEAVTYGFSLKRIFLRFLASFLKNIQPQRTIVKLLPISLKNSFLRAGVDHGLMQYLRCCNTFENTSRLSDVNNYCHNELHLRCCNSLISDWPLCAGVPYHSLSG